MHGTLLKSPPNMYHALNTSRLTSIADFYYFSQLTYSLRTPEKERTSWLECRITAGGYRPSRVSVNFVL